MFSFAGIVLIGGNNTPEPTFTLSANIEVICRVVVDESEFRPRRIYWPFIHVIIE